MIKSNYDYSQTMMMKLCLANPDNKGGSIVYCNFEHALEIIKTVDNLTYHAPKIIYLVGWQYLGHDDRYPEFFEVNENLKRECDNSAKDSLIWLMNEAKKYHTVVSLHINLSDAYPESLLWQEYLDNNLILLNSKGKPKATGTWNNRKAYQVRFAQEYKSGYFKKRVDTLLNLIPVSKAKTIHIDAFFVRKGKDTTIAEEKKYRRKMIEYFNSKGIDVTSEFIYREQNNGYRSLWGDSDIIGVIPAVWNLKMTQKDFLNISPKTLAGGRLTKGLQRDINLKYLFYGNIHGENVFLNKSDDWKNDFLYEFATENLPYFYLNSFERLKISGIGNLRYATFSSNVISYIKNKKITKNGRIVKENDTVFLPIHWAKGEYYAYSKKALTREFDLFAKEVEIFSISDNGNKFLEKRDIVNNKIQLSFDDNCAFVIKKTK